MQSHCPACKKEILEKSLKPASPYDKPAYKVLGMPVYKSTKVGLCPHCQARLMRNFLESDAFLLNMHHFYLPIIVLSVINHFTWNTVWVSLPILVLVTTLIIYNKYKTSRQDFKDREQWKLESEL